MASGVIMPQTKVIRRKWIISSGLYKNGASRNSRRIIPLNLSLYRLHLRQKQKEQKKTMKTMWQPSMCFSDETVILVMFNLAKYRGTYPVQSSYFDLFVSLRSIHWLYAFHFCCISVHQN